MVYDRRYNYLMNEPTLNQLIGTWTIERFIYIILYAYLHIDRDTKKPFPVSVCIHIRFVTFARPEIKTVIADDSNIFRPIQSGTKRKMTGELPISLNCCFPFGVTEILGMPWQRSLLLQHLVFAVVVNLFACQRSRMFWTNTFPKRIDLIVPFLLENVFKTWRKFYRKHEKTFQNPAANLLNLLYSTSNFNAYQLHCRTSREALATYVLSTKKSWNRKQKTKMC